MEIRSRILKNKRQSYWLVLLLIGIVLLNGVRADNEAGIGEKRGVPSENAVNNKETVKHEGDATKRLENINKDHNDDHETINDGDVSHGIETDNGDKEAIKDSLNKDGIDRIEVAHNDEADVNRDGDETGIKLDNEKEKDVINANEDMFRIDEKTTISKNQTGR